MMERTQPPTPNPQRSVSSVTSAWRAGQSALEYAVLIALVVAGILGMQGYVRRALMDRWFQGAQSLGQPYVAGRTVGLHVFEVTGTSHDDFSSVDELDSQGRTTDDKLLVTRTAFSEDTRERGTVETSYPAGQGVWKQ